LFPNFLKFKEAQEQTQHLLELAQEETRVKKEALKLAQEEARVKEEALKLAQEEARVKEEELKQMKSGT
jgi:hypothetical protein